MPDFFNNTDELENSSLALLHKSHKRKDAVFIILILIILVTLIALPLIHTDISIKSPGIIRPANERTDIKSITSGIIDSIYCTEGDLVKKNGIILRLKDYTTRDKIILNEQQQQQYRDYIRDLEVLTTKIPDQGLIRQLHSALYRAQANRFVHRWEEQEAMLKKADKEVMMNTSLAKEKIISPKEFFDIQIQQQKTNASIKALMQDQLSEWQQEIIKYRSGLAQYEEQHRQLDAESQSYVVRSPVTGTVQGINMRYAGGFLQANDLICSVSPDGEIIAECYISPKDIGFIKKDQQVHFQVDAFNYNYFGMLTGKVIAVDDDYTIINNKLVFRVRCNLADKHFHIKNKLIGEVKKGLTLQARFIAGSRTLSQLLFDKMDDWLNPVAPGNSDY